MDHIKFYQPGSQPYKPPIRFIPYTGDKASSSSTPVSKSVSPTPKRKRERNRLKAQTAGPRPCQEKDPLLKPCSKQTQETSIDDPQSFMQSFTPEEGTQNGDYKAAACDDDPLYNLFYDDNDEPDMRAITTSGAAQNGTIRETSPHESKGAQQNGGSPCNKGCGDEEYDQVDEVDEIPETQFPHTNNSEDQLDDDDKNLHLTRVASTMSLSPPPAQPATGGLESSLGSGILCTQPSHSGADSTPGDTLRTQVEPGDSPDIPILITDDDPPCLGDDRNMARADVSQSDTTSGSIGGPSDNWEQAEVISDGVIKEERESDSNGAVPRASKRKHGYLSPQEASQYDRIEVVNLTGATDGSSSQRANSKRPKLSRPRSLPSLPLAESKRAPVSRCHCRRDQSSLAYEEPLQTESSTSPDVKPGGFSREYSYKRLTGYKTINGIPHVRVAWLQSMEPAELFPADEVEEIKQRCALRSLGQRGRPSQPQAKQVKRPGRPPKPM